jgi:hypothetical protein
MAVCEQLLWDETTVFCDWAVRRFYRESSPTPSNSEIKQDVSP